VTEPKPGVYTSSISVRTSQEIERVRLQGPAGTDVRLRFAEIVNDDGTIYIDNLRTAKVTDHFILSGQRHRRIYAPIHISRIPLRRDHRPSIALPQKTL
jgi:hypothetical protein